ncbi:expressed unknown protein [Seminavis robusta]|uniref:Uncharacterized protein n=1 Tax=Seminavis robusta TaxID=568900 RepID=A0A9N8HQT4_9STRA|nr:expressed unknown protein [Seminavis robusta]|eukprot:Sro1483_g276380.1 n/a (305) ;mRNA; r:8522-9536
MATNLLLFVYLVFVTLGLFALDADAFSPLHHHHHKTSCTTLFMGKGLNKFKNKQADLKRKLELAKQQNKKDDIDDDDDTSQQKHLTDEEIKEQNDRKRFEQLLQREGATMLNNYESEGYLSTQQEEEEITAARSGADRIFEGDPAPVDCFEGLVSVTTEKSIAKKGTGRLVPWLAKDYNIDHDDYRVIICDPRQQSTDLHQAMKDLNGALPKDIKDRLYYINADTPAENRRWLKKNGLRHLDVYCDDDDKTWMRSYTALGDKRWYISMFVIHKGKVSKLVREMDVYNAPKTVLNAVKAMKSEQL